MATSQERINVPIFVSSTYEDLVPYRDEVERCIIRMNQTIRGMEFFGSNPESPLEVCLKTVRESKIYVGGTAAYWTSPASPSQSWSMRRR